MNYINDQARMSNDEGIIALELPPMPVSASATPVRLAPRTSGGRTLLWFLQIRLFFALRKTVFPPVRQPPD